MEQVIHLPGHDIAADDLAAGEHSLAESAVEAILCIKTILDGCLPPTINYEHPDPNCDLDYVPNVARAKRINATLSNSLGFGGHNTALKQWSLTESRGVTELALGEAARVRFDPSAPGLLWVGTADGKLSLWDSHAGKRRVVAGVQRHAPHPGHARKKLEIAEADWRREGAVRDGGACVRW